MKVNKIDYYQGDFCDFDFYKSEYDHEFKILNGAILNYHREVGT